jgi:hypothetical protein
VKDIFSTIVERTLQKNLFLQNKAKLARFGQSGQSPHPSLIPKITSKQCKSVLISVKKLSVKSAQSASMIPKVSSLASGVRCLVSELIRENLCHRYLWPIKEQFLCKTNPIFALSRQKNVVYPKNEPNSNPNEANFLASLLTNYDLISDVEYDR